MLGRTPHAAAANASKVFQILSRRRRITNIRRQIILEEFTRPVELINFLADIYGPDKFKDLVETKVRNRSYYCILVDGNRYIREDYLSSGEYFLLNLYRTFRSNVRLIVVDEIDMSLDAAAQVHLLSPFFDFARNMAGTCFSPRIPSQ